MSIAWMAEVLVFLFHRRHSYRESRKELCRSKNVLASYGLSTDIPELRRQSWADFCDVGVNLVYTVSSRLARAV